MLPRTPETQDNKYTRGKLVVVAGCARYPGAAALAGAAGYAALRMGSGYAQVLTDARCVAPVQAYRPSLVVQAWGEDGHLPCVLEASRPGKPCAYVVGPGFDADDEVCRPLLAALLEVRAPLVVDGGALAVLADDGLRAQLVSRGAGGAAGEGALAGAGAGASVGAGAGWPTVLTPHGGEAARLARAVGLDPGSLAGNDPAGIEGMAAVLARAYHCIVVCKGPVTYVSDGRRTAVMDEGVPALSKAGTGDVLAGMTGGILAQGASDGSALGAEEVFATAFAAARLHAAAARCACEKVGDISLTAEDVVEAIPQAILGSAAMFEKMGSYHEQ